MRKVIPYWFLGSDAHIGSKAARILGICKSGAPFPVVPRTSSRKRCSIVDSLKTFRWLRRLVSFFKNAFPLTGRANAKTAKIMNREDAMICNMKEELPTDLIRDGSVCFRCY